MSTGLVPGARIVARAAVLALSVGCVVSSAGATADSRSGPGSVHRQVEAEATPQPSCASGRLTIADLPAIEDAFVEGVAAEGERAEAWRDDARLVGVRVGCRLLDNGFNWRGIFFSDEIQTYLFSDTGETKTVDAVAPPGPTLELDDVSFDDLHRSLIRAGYAEDVALNPSTNVEIRLHSQEAPFGPPEAPLNAVYFHVALESRGEVIDLFVGATDGTLFQFRREG